MAKQESKETKTPAAEAAKPAKSKMTLVLMVLLILVAGAAGFFGWKYFTASKADAAAHGDEATHDEDHNEDSKSAKSKKKKKIKAGEEGATISFEPFLVNLADKEASRYLKTSVRLLVSEKEVAESIAKGDVLIPKMRDTILTLLSTKRADEITSNEGKEKLKHEILERVNEYLPNEAVQEVFFTDFVVQF
jgi:flagellar FliL protein